MSRLTKTTAYTGAVLALALTLTGCDGGGAPADTSTPASASQSSREPIWTVSPSSSASAPSESASSTSAAASSSDAFAAFEPVTSKAPTSEEEGKAKAFETVQLYYEVQTALLQKRDPQQVDALSVVVADPYLTQEQEGLRRAFEGKKRTYEGGSKPELISAIAGPLVASDGSLTDYSSVTLKVCEDNTGVKVKDEKGEPVGTGTPRYVVDYSARWYPNTEEWKVTSSAIPKEKSTC